MARSRSDRPPRSVPSALLWIGIPAYLGVVGFTIRDLVNEHAAVGTAAGIICIAVFTVIFLATSLAITPDGVPRPRTAAILVMLVLAGILASLGLTTAVFGASVAATAGQGLPSRRSIPIILAAAAITLTTAIATGFDGPDALTQPIIVLIVGLFTYGVQRLAATNRELVTAREEVARLAVLDERVRFARDLHDLLGHSLTVIRAKSELATRLAPTDIDAATREMSEVERVAREALVEVRETISGYRRPSLAGEVETARTALESAGITADVRVDVQDVPPVIEETLAWVLREMVTNVVRHSRASTCRITATIDDNAWELAVIDDGQGASAGTGNGLAGAQERLALVHGSLDLDSQADGFRAVARVPVAR